MSSYTLALVCTIQLQFSNLVFAYVVNEIQSKLNVIEKHFNKNVYLHAHMHVFSFKKMLKGALCNFVQNCVNTPSILFPKLDFVLP